MKYQTIKILKKETYQSGLFVNMTDNMVRVTFICSLNEWPEIKGHLTNVIQQDKIMAKYRKKPIVVEAFQVTEAAWWADFPNWPGWVQAAWEKGAAEGGIWIDSSTHNGCPLVCGTLEGVHRITWGDFIVQGIDGEIYPCKPSIFKKTYDVVE